MSDLWLSAAGCLASELVGAGAVAGVVPGAVAGDVAGVVAGVL